MNRDYPKNDISTQEAKKRIVKLGTKQMLKNQISRKSYLSLFLSSIKFVGWKLWSIQFALLGFSLFLMFSKGEMSYEHVLRGITGMVLFSVIFFTDELFKSFTNNMWELEQTFKYDLRQHTAMKMLVFGVFDLLLILILAVVGKQIFHVSFLSFALYLLAPFNVFCIVLFSIFTLLRNNLSNLLLWTSSGVLVAVSIITEEIFNIYSFPLSYWTIVYVITSIGLLALIRQMLKKHNMVGDFI